MRIIYCGDRLEQHRKLPEHCIDLIYIDSPFWDETKEKRAPEDRHASPQAFHYMRPRSVEPARVLMKTGSFYFPPRLVRVREAVS